jgi:GT2 family glycosyltransferase
VSAIGSTDIKAAVVILHYGAPDTTRRLHDQLRQSDPDLDASLFVLDNAAPLPYPDAWRRLEQNIFWAGGLDYAARAVRDMGYTHLWFLNNDIDFVSRPPHLGRALGRLARLEGTLGRVGLYSPAFAKSPYHPQMVVLRAGGQYREVSVMDGVAPLISLDCLEDLGGVDFEGNLFGYGVDIVLSSQAHAAGWKLVVDHQVVVRHRHHTAARSVPEFMDVAAKAEAGYLTKRLGRDYKERIATWQAESRESDIL